jgi:DNA-binding HxlR family transcriptional regulator
MEHIKRSGRGDVHKKTCPSRDVLDLVADKWTVLIIHSLSKSSLRHNALARELEGISQKVLTQALRKLERNGLITRTVYPVVPPHVEYALSPIGRSLIGILGTLSSWSETHFPQVISARERYDKAGKH